MSRNVPITWEKEQQIIAALEKDPHASRVPRALGDVSYATPWRIADRNAIALAAGRETMGQAAAGPACGEDRSGQTRMPRRTRLRSKPASAGQACGASKGMGAGRMAVKPKARRAEWRICRQCS